MLYPLALPGWGHFHASFPIRMIMTTYILPLLELWRQQLSPSLTYHYQTGRLEDGILCILIHRRGKKKCEELSDVITRQCDTNRSQGKKGKKKCLATLNLLFFINTILTCPVELRIHTHTHTGLYVTRGPTFWLTLVIKVIKPPPPKGSGEMNELMKWWF